MKNVLFLLCISINLLVSTNTYSKTVQRCALKPIIVAVVDTGFGFEGAGQGAKLCKYGHKDFTKEQKYTSAYGTADPVPLDLINHGTNIVGVIEDQLKSSNVNFCIVVLKFYTKVGAETGENVANTIVAFDYARNIKADYINYSAGGLNPSQSEKESVVNYLNSGGHLIAAAGNEGRNLDLPGNTYYPAMYDKRIIVVGGINLFGMRMPQSNYGSVVNRWEIGTFTTGYGITLSGTSQATATATGKIVLESKNKCDIGK